MLQGYLILAAVILFVAKAQFSESRVKLSESTQINYIQQNLDHFSFANDKTFQQKYLLNDQFWSPEDNSPIFFELGGESPIGEGFNVRV